MSTSSGDESEDLDARPQDLGLTVASAFYVNRPAKKCQPSDEKKQLLQSWSAKSDQIHSLYEHYENVISSCLQQETSLLITDILHYVKHQARSSFGYIPTAIIRHGVRMTDRDAVFDLIESGLIASACAAEVVRLEASHTSDTESMKKKIISDIMTDALLSRMSGKEKVRKSYEQRLPFRYFAQSFAATMKRNQNEDRMEPVIIMIEELEKADGGALTSLFSMLKNSMSDMPVILMLGCCTNHLSLQQLLPAKAYDMLFVRGFQTASASVMFARVMNEITMSSALYSFKLDPTCLKLLQDNFDFYNFSLEKILSIIKLMIVKHVSNHHYCTILSVTSADELKLILKKMSTSQLKQLRAAVEQLPSIESAAAQLKKIGTSDWDSFRNFIKKSINQIHNCHNEYEQAMRCLSILMAKSSESSDRLANTMITPFVSLNADGISNITETNEFRHVMKSLSTLSVDEVRQKLETCTNNHLASDSSIAQMLQKEFEKLLKLGKDADSADEVVSEAPASSASADKRQSRVTFEGCRNRHEWKARMKNSLTSKADVTMKKKLTKFEKFRTEFVSSVSEFFASLTPPFSLPLSEVVYFTDSSFIADHYFPGTRTKIIESFRRPLLMITSPDNHPVDDEVGESDDPELDMTRVYRQFASSSVSIGLLDMMECLISQKDSSRGLSEEADVSPRKKVRKGKAASTSKSNKETSEVILRQRFFTLINDMEYTGFLQKDKRKAGRVTKLVWE
jgi:hypothetical protein